MWQTSWRGFTLPTRSRDVVHVYAYSGCDHAFNRFKSGSERDSCLINASERRESRPAIVGTAFQFWNETDGRLATIFRSFSTDARILVPCLDNGTIRENGT